MYLRAVLYCEGYYDKGNTNIYKFPYLYNYSAGIPGTMKIEHTLNPSTQY